MTEISNIYLMFNVIILIFVVFLKWCFYFFNNEISEFLVWLRVFLGYNTQKGCIYTH